MIIRISDNNDKRMRTLELLASSCYICHEDAQLAIIRVVYYMAGPLVIPARMMRRARQERRNYVK